MRNLHACPAYLENDDECTIVDELHIVRCFISAINALNEDEGEAKCSKQDAWKISDIPIRGHNTTQHEKRWYIVSCIIFISYIFLRTKQEKEHISDQDSNAMHPNKCIQLGFLLPKNGKSLTLQWICAVNMHTQKFEKFVDLCMCQVICMHLVSEK